MFKSYFRKQKKFLRYVTSLLLVAIIVIVGLFQYSKKSEAAWLNDGWGYRLKLTIDHTKVGANQTDFPVYVPLSILPSSFHQHVNQTDARDIRVTKSDGSTELPREVVFYTASTHTGELHFKYTGTLSSSTDISVYIYYGNASASDYAASDTYGKNNVWDSSYSGVHHVQNSSFSDSTSGAHNATNNNSTSATGHAGDGRLMDADGEYFSVPLSGYVHASVNTIEWWYKNTTAPLSYSSFFNSSEGGDQLTFSRNASNTTLNLNLNNSNFIDWPSLATNVFDGNWHHIVVALDTVANTEDLYIDGTNRGQKTQNPANIDISTYNLLWGGNTSSAPVNGIIDEARVSSNILRSSTWISTEYNNQNSPSTFFTSLGTEEQNKMPVLYFGFNEGYGTTTADLSTNTYTGTFAGATKPTWQQDDLCISGKCLYFQGSTASVTTTTVSNVQSVSFWVKPKTNGEALVELDSGVNYIAASAGTITATGFSTPIYYINGLATTTPTLTANVWQHITVTTTSPIDAISLQIGVNDVTFFNGFIDEFKLYDYVRSAAEVKSDYIIGAGSKGSAAVLSAVNPNIVGPVSSGLVGYWRMDENTGQAVNDSSGTGNNATLGTSSSVSSDDPAWTTGKFGSGLLFDGSTDLVRADDSDTLSFGNGTTDRSFTMSGWINPTVGTSQYVFTKFTEYEMRFGSDGRLICSQLDASTSGYIGRNWTGPVATNAWYHVSCTYDGSSTSAGTKIYVNGVRVDNADEASGSYVAMENSTNSFRLADTFFTGSMDDMRIYNRALSPNEINQLYNWAPGPIGWWKMDEGSWTNNCSTDTVFDSSGNGNSGDACPSSTGPVGGAVGKFGNAGNFDGTNDYVATSMGNSVKGSSQVTVEAWINPSILDGTDRQIYTEPRNADGSIRFGLRVNTDNQLLFAGRAPDSDAGTVWVDDTRTLSVNTWYHVAAVFDSVTDVHYIYLNGVRVSGSVVEVGFDTTNPETVPKIGSEPNGAENFAGKIDDVRIYNYARTSAQIIEDMNTGHPLSGSPIGSAVGHFKFDEGHDDTLNNSGNCGSTCNLARAGATKPSWSNSGKFEKALSYAGSNAYSVASGDPSAFKITDKLTLSAWINLTNTSSVHDIIAKKGASGNYAYRLFTDTNGKLNMEISKDGTTLTGGTNGATLTGSRTLSTSTWYHVLGTYTPSVGMTLYVNGYQDATTASVPSSIFNSTVNLEVGGENTTTNLMTGIIDEVKVFNADMTAGQVLTIFNQNSSLVMGALSTDSTGIANSSANDSYCPPGQGSACIGPIGEWKMDENTGTSANDSSGNGYIGTLNGNSTWAPGKFGPAVLLKGGSTDNVNIPDQDAFSIVTTNQLTVESWVKFNTVTSTQHIVSKHQSGQYEWALRLNADGTPRAFVYNSAAGTYLGDQSAPALTAGQWYFLAFTVNSSSPDMKFYENGIQTSDTTSTSGTIKGNGSAPVKFGESSDANNEMQGAVDNVRIYNYVRTPAQIAWDYNLGKPIGWWKMDECTGDTLYDASLLGSGAAGGKNGTRSGTSGTNTSSGNCTTVDTATAWYNGRSGKFNGSLDFDSSDDVVSIANASVIDLNEGLSNQFTISAWIYPQSDGETSNGRIFQKSTDGGASILEAHVMAESGGIVNVSVYLDLSGSDVDYQISTLPIPINQWTHVALGWTNDDDDEITVWVNGKSKVTGGGSGDIVADSGSLFIGGNGTGTNNTRAFDGQIDDFRVYNYELTAQQVKTVMNQGAAVRFGPLTGSP